MLDALEIERESLLYERMDVISKDTAFKVVLRTMVDRVDSSVLAWRPVREGPLKPPLGQ